MSNSKPSSETLNVFKSRVYTSSKYLLPSISCVQPRPRLPSSTTHMLTKCTSSYLAARRPKRLSSSIAVQEKPLLDPLIAASRPRFLGDISKSPAALRSSTSEARQPRALRSRASRSRNAASRLLEDQYYFKNVIRRQFTFFQDLLQLSSEGVFSYMSRVSKIKPVRGPLQDTHSTPEPRCTCSLPSKKLALLRHFTPAQHTAVTSAGLIRLFARPSANVQCPGKLVIFRLDKTLLTSNYGGRGQVYGRPGLGRALRKLQEYFQLVFVASTSTYLSYLDTQGVNTSGYYLLPSSHSKIGVDYSIIFEDLWVQNPHCNAVVITSLDLEPEEIDAREGEQLISERCGLRTRLFISDVPLADTPLICMVLPALNKGEPTIRADCVAKLLLQNQEFTPLTKKLTTVRTTAVAEALLEEHGAVTAEQIRSLTQVADPCSVHHTSQPTPRGEHYFVVMKPSQFPVLRPPTWLM